MMFPPGLLFLHTWKNLSYKTLSIPKRIAVFIAPALAAAYTLVNALNGAAVPPVMRSDAFAAAVSTALYIYLAVIIVRTYLVCFNVFYQMPRHMRRSTYKILTSVTALAGHLVFALLVRRVMPESIASMPVVQVALPVLEAALLGVSVYSLYDALIFPAKDVIATSRDFVFGRLSTFVLVLSENHRILDWNRKKRGGSLPLPDPAYMEPFYKYRERILRAGNGRVSPRDDSVISLMEGSKEWHFRIASYPIVNDKQEFGYVVEIAEINRIGEILRELEDFAMTDQLTGMFNRNAYTQMVPQIAVPANMPLAVLVGDVNDLKYINDNVSHLGGDKLLKCVSKIILDNIPPDTYAARVGGDEFILLIPRAGSAMAKAYIQAAGDACEKIHDDLFGTPSIAWGYAVLDSQYREFNETEYEQAVLRADAMMYEIKRVHPSQIPRRRIDLYAGEKPKSKTTDGSLEDSTG
jgi:diguanylate cyclase (GGDEF)-like protein